MKKLLLLCSIVLFVSVNMYGQTKEKSLRPTQQKEAQKPFNDFDKKYSEMWNTGNDAMAREYSQLNFKNSVCKWVKTVGVIQGACGIIIIAGSTGENDLSIQGASVLVSGAFTFIMGAALGGNCKTKARILLRSFDGRTIKETVYIEPATSGVGVQFRF